LARGIEFWRGGETAAYPTLEEGANPTISGSGIDLMIAFRLRSKGGGITDVSVRIPPSEFDRLSKAMAEVHEIRATVDKMMD
jgi:hypothetical protein